MIMIMIMAVGASMVETKTFNRVSQHRSMCSQDLVSELTMTNRCS